MSKSKARVKKATPSQPAMRAAAEKPKAPDSLEAVIVPETLSFPPVSAAGEAVDEEPFFSRPSSPDAFAEPEVDEEPDEVRQERILRESPEVRARVAKARRMVFGFVGACAVLMLGGFGAKAFEGGKKGEIAEAQAESKPVALAEAAKPEKPSFAVNSLAATNPLAEATKVVEAAKPTEAAPLEAAKAAEAPVAEAAKPAESAKPAEAPKAPEAAPEAAKPAESAKPADPATPTKTALEEKKDCQRALDRGKAKDAIAAGERSVALDPTDGEAWLLLGAAYQESGKGGEARRCYTACIKEGKRGPKGECAAMLR